MKDLKYLLLVCIWLHFAAENFAQSNPLYDYNSILKMQINNLPSTVNNNVWTSILEAYDKPISQTWMAPWLGLSYMKTNEKISCQAESKNGINSLDKCKSSIIFVDELQEKLVSYKGNWMGCDSRETYIFHKHSVHEIYLWIAQQEDWLANISKPVSLDITRHKQSYTPKTSSPVNIFEFELNTANEITFLKAEYKTSSVHIVWEFSSGKNNSTLLKIMQDCQLTNDKK